ncbi:MAG: ribosome maturation factor RimP [Chitinophagales bacterium]
METNEVSARATALGEPIAAELGLELVQVEFRKEAGNWILRYTIDKPSGRVGITDCEEFSRRAGKELDRLDFIPHQYHLEVSSPGAERPLVKESDFVRFAGEWVNVRLFGPFEGRRTWEGTLVARTAAGLVLEVEGRTVTIPSELVSKVRLAIKF